METTGAQTTQATPTEGSANVPSGIPGHTNNNVPGKADANSTTTATIKEAAAEAKRRLKIDDQEIDEDEVIKVYKDRKGHQRAANKELQEGRAAKKQAEEFVRLLKSDPVKLLSDPRIGHDVRKLAEEYLAAQLQEEMLDPREKELKDYKTKLQKYQDLEKQQKEAVAKRRDLELKKKFAEDYSNQFVAALKTSGLPPTKGMVSQMAKYIHDATKMDFKMTADEAAKLVREDIELAHKNLYGEADAETLVRLIGEQGLQKIRTHDTSRLKDPAAQLKTPTEQGEVTRKREAGQRMSPSEWRAFNRR